MNELSTIQQIIVWSLPVIFAVTVHETAHGWVAKQYGDNTAFMQGRLTINPIKHIDLVGTIIVPGLLLLLNSGFMFAWAKPVPVDTRYFKNPAKAMAVVALAGPASNILMAIGWTGLLRLAVVGGNVDWAQMLGYMAIAGVSINLVLALVNLIPIPPLDGSRVLRCALPHRLAWQYDKLERYGLLLMLLLLWSGALGYLLGTPLMLLQQLLFSLVGG